MKKNYFLAHNARWVVRWTATKKNVFQFQKARNFQFSFPSRDVNPEAPLISRSQTRDCSLSAASSSAAGPEGVCCCWCLLSSPVPESATLCWIRCCCYARLSLAGGPWARDSCTRAGAPATSPSSTGIALSGPSAVTWCQRSGLPMSPIRASGCWCTRVSSDDTSSPRFCSARDVAFVDLRLRASTDKKCW